MEDLAKGIKFSYMDTGQDRGQTMAKRPVNKCGGCGHTWFPRGADKSAACPKCAGTAITTSVEEEAQRSMRCCCCLLILCALGAAVVFGTGPMSWKDPVGEAPQPRPTRSAGDGGGGDGIAPAVSTVPQVENESGQ